MYILETSHIISKNHIFIFVGFALERGFFEGLRRISFISWQD
jgi:hypothetical protein